jgi:hypothetical protein
MSLLCVKLQGHSLAFITRDHLLYVKRTIAAIIYSSTVVAA